MLQIGEARLQCAGVAVAGTIAQRLDDLGQTRIDYIAQVIFARQASGD